MNKIKKLLDGFETINEAQMHATIAGGTSYDTCTSINGKADCSDGPGNDEPDLLLETYLMGDVQPTSFSMDT